MTSPDDNIYIAGKNRQLMEKDTELYLEKLKNSGHDPVKAAAIRRAEDAEDEASRLQEQLDASKKQLEEAQKVIAAKSELIKDWMHSNEAMKRLAKKYGKELGVKDEQRIQEYDELILDVAEEDPKKASGLLVKRAKERLGKT